MLYLRLEIWPGGDKSKARLISEATITNITAKAVPDPPDYSVEVSGEGGFDTGGSFARGLLFHFPYEKSIQNVWNLVSTALDKVRYPI